MDDNVVVITGAAGFIGSHLCEYFLAHEWTVIGFDNFLSGAQKNIDHLLPNKNFFFTKQDVTHALSVSQKVSLVLHFACPASPVDYMAHPIETMKVNSIGTFSTLQLAKEHNATYVLASTSEIYGDPTQHPQTEEYWGNVNPVGPRSVYDEAKRFSEALTVSYFREYNMDTRIVRIFNTYGSHMRPNDGRVIPNFINQALFGKKITVYGDGQQTRSFCHVSDLIDGIYRLSTFQDLQGKIINLGNPEEYTILELLDIIKKKISVNTNVVFQNLPEDDPRRRKPDITKAKKYLRWNPKIKLEEGIEETIQYFSDQL